MIDIVKSQPVFVPIFADIDAAIKLMISGRRSCLLVYDGDEAVVGIVTERDILRKLSILDVDRKLNHKVNTIMTMNVKFAHDQTLLDDIRKLHKIGLRHFPVAGGQEKPHKKDVVGLVTMTDIGRAYLSHSLGASL